MAKRRTQTSQSRRILFAVGLTLLVGTSSALVWFFAFGADPSSQAINRDGLVRVPRTLRPLKALEKIQQEDLIDPRLGEDTWFWIPQEFVDQNPQWITDKDQIIGRVLRSDKLKDRQFEEDDFLPEGSSTGIAGGIPDGKQGFFLRSEKIPGLRFLQKGDRFDLLATVETEPDTLTNEYGALMGGIKVLAGKPIPLNGVRILVQDAEIIALTNNSSMTTQGGLDLAQDTRSRLDTTSERVAIAIDPEEAIPLTQALGNDLEIHMVTRSGQKARSDDQLATTENLIGVASNSITLKPYTAIRASDLTDTESGQLRQYFFQPETLKPEWIQDPKLLIGRVVNREIEPGYLFTEKDFLPAGSLTKPVQAFESIPAESLVGSITSPWLGRVAARDMDAGATISETDLLPPGTEPGIAAAIPDDRVSMTLETKQIRGADELARGDQFDLLSTSPTSIDQALTGIQISPALLSNLESTLVNKVIAERVIVLVKEDNQLTIALKPSEITEVTKSLASEQEVFCITRSAIDRTNESDSPLAPKEAAKLESEPSPLQGITISETIIGGNRILRAYGDSK